MVGTNIAHYEIFEKVGEGGMGQVYRARDTRLDRTVAIKVLPQHLSEQPGFRQRFEREARAISSLAHPHICTLHDVGRENGTDYLVMEFLEGESLADKLRRGPLPTNEVLEIGIQIADALDKAHSEGLIHRDLKPGNVMLTQRGAKMLDFGLAKSSVTGDDTDLTSTPTVTSPLTAAGSIVGTYQYMAPEQLEGEEVDARSDIFSFGAVLHEMATGRKAFEGKTQASLIASILKEEPQPISAITSVAPLALDRVVNKCLQKDPNKRWQTARDLMHELEWISEGGSLVDVPAHAAPRRKSLEKLSWGVAALGILAGIAGVGFGLGLFTSKPAPQTVRFEVQVPPRVTSIGTPKMSPDGRFLAFDASGPDGNTMIWVRALNALEARPLPGTESAGRAFWSPDSRYLAFFSGGKLKKVNVAGGPAQSLCEAGTGADGTWGAAGQILFDGSVNDSLRVVASAGGPVSPASRLDRSRGESYHAWPYFLPNGRDFLFLASAGGDETLEVGSLGSDERKTLGSFGSRIEYSPTGHLVFVQDGALMAQPFDVDALELTGEPFPIAESISMAGSGLADFSLSRNGVLAYRTGGSGEMRLVWVDREGREIEQVGEPGDYSNLSLSPDGKRISVDVSDDLAGPTDVWLLEPGRDIMSRFTFGTEEDGRATWSPDGRHLVYASTEKDSRRLVVKPAAGGGGARVIVDDEFRKDPNDWSDDGRLVAYHALRPDTGWDVLIARADGEGESEVFYASPATDGWPVFSPDGKWIAYASDESGRFEVYVQPYPGPGGKWQVSNNGGAQPMWPRNGNEILYVQGDRGIVAVPVETTHGFEAAVPNRLFLAPIIRGFGNRSRIVPDPEGRRFLLLTPQLATALAPTTVVLNWDSELESR